MVISIVVINSSQLAGYPLGGGGGGGFLRIINDLFLIIARKHFIIPSIWM